MMLKARDEMIFISSLFFVLDFSLFGVYLLESALSTDRVRKYRTTV